MGIDNRYRYTKMTPSDKTKNSPRFIKARLPCFP